MVKSRSKCHYFQWILYHLSTVCCGSDYLSFHGRFCIWLNGDISWHGRLIPLTWSAWILSFLCYVSVFTTSKAGSSFLWQVHNCLLSNVHVVMPNFVFFHLIHILRNQILHMAKTLNLEVNISRRKGLFWLLLFWNKLEQTFGYRPGCRLLKQLRTLLKQSASVFILHSQNPHLDGNVWFLKTYLRNCSVMRCLYF